MKPSNQTQEIINEQYSEYKRNPAPANEEDKSRYKGMTLSLIADAYHHAKFLKPEDFKGSDINDFLAIKDIFYKIKDQVKFDEHEPEMLITQIKNYLGKKYCITNEVIFSNGLSIVIQCDDEIEIDFSISKEQVRFRAIGNGNTISGGVQRNTGKTIGDVILAIDEFISEVKKPSSAKG